MKPHDELEPGPGKHVVEIRTQHFGFICRACGQLAAPQMAEVHFVSFWSVILKKWMWRVEHFEHLNCMERR